MHHDFPNEAIARFRATSRACLTLIALGAVLSSGCALTGPNLRCLQGCERQNDSCMMHAGDAAALQMCDEGMGRCASSCR